MNSITIGRLTMMLVCYLLSTSTIAQEFGGTFFLSIRDCTGIAADDSCARPGPGDPPDRNDAVLQDFRDLIIDSASATISSGTLGSAEGQVLFDGSLNTPTIRNKIITTSISRNAATLTGTQRLTYAGSAPALVTFGGAFTYQGTGNGIDENCQLIKFFPGGGGTIVTRNPCRGMTVRLDVRDAETNLLLSRDEFVSWQEPSPLPPESTFESIIELIPGKAYDVTARVVTVTRGAGQSIDSNNSFEVGLVDPETGNVTKEIPPTLLPQLAGVLIPASDPIQPSGIEIDVLPGSSTNPVGVNRTGVLPVALITTPDFHAPDVDRDSLSFGPGAAGVALPGGGPEDVDGDGDLDYVVHFSVQESGISCGDAEVFVSGTTTSGDIIVGGDTITPKGCE